MYDKLYIILHIIDAIMERYFQRDTSRERHTIEYYKREVENKRAKKKKTGKRVKAAANSTYTKTRQAFYFSSQVSLCDPSKHAASRRSAAEKITHAGQQHDTNRCSSAPEATANTR